MGYSIWAKCRVTRDELLDTPWYFNSLRTRKSPCWIEKSSISMGNIFPMLNYPMGCKLSLPLAYSYGVLGNTRSKPSSGDTERVHCYLWVSTCLQTWKLIMICLAKSEEAASSKDDAVAAISPLGYPQIWWFIIISTIKCPRNGEVSPTGVPLKNRLPPVMLVGLFNPVNYT